MGGIVEFSKGKGNPVPRDNAPGFNTPVTRRQTLEFLGYTVAVVAGVKLAKDIVDAVTDEAHQDVVLSGKDRGTILTIEDLQQQRLPNGSVNLKPWLWQRITLPEARVQFHGEDVIKSRDIFDKLYLPLARQYKITINSGRDIGLELIGEDQVSVDDTSKTTSTGLRSEKNLYPAIPLVGEVLPLYDNNNRPTGEVFFNILGRANSLNPLEIPQ